MVTKHVVLSTNIWRCLTSGGFTLVSVSSSSTGRYISHKASGLCLHACLHRQTRTNSVKTSSRPSTLSSVCPRPSITSDCLRPVTDLFPITVNVSLVKVRPTGNRIYGSACHFLLHWQSARHTWAGESAERFISAHRRRRPVINVHWWCLSDLTSVIRRRHHCCRSSVCVRTERMFGLSDFLPVIH